MTPEQQQAGAAGLKLWREARAAAKSKGTAAFALWEESEARKKALKKTTPVQAIKNFCNDCVGGVQKDITHCTAYKCALYIYRPYQKDVENEPS